MARIARSTITLMLGLGVALGVAVPGAMAAGGSLPSTSLPSACTDTACVETEDTAVCWYGGREEPAVCFSAL